MADTVYNVDATALFYARPSPDMGDLLTELNGKLADFDGCHLTMSPLSHADWWLLACEHFHIMLTFSDMPAIEGKFASALQSQITTLRRFDYDQVANTHQAFVNVEIGDGAAPLPPEARIIMQEFGSSTTCDPDLKLRALHYTSQFIAGHQGFLALHFGPSDRMFCPEELKESAGHGVPTPLLVHPVPSLPEPGPNGSDGYALRLRNPHHLRDVAIELEGLPVSVPLKTSVALLNTLMKAHRAGKLGLAHGKVLRPSPKYALYVREALPDEDAPLGRMILSFWKDRGHDAPRPSVDQTVQSLEPAQLVATEPAASEYVQQVAQPVDAQVVASGARPVPALTDPEPEPEPLSVVPVDTAHPMQLSTGPEAEPEPLEPVAIVAKRRGMRGWIADRLRGPAAHAAARVACFVLVFGAALVASAPSGHTDLAGDQKAAIVASLN